MNMVVGFKDTDFVRRKIDTVIVSVGNRDEAQHYYHAREALDQGKLMSNTATLRFRCILSPARSLLDFVYIGLS